MVANLQAQRQATEAMAAIARLFPELPGAVVQLSSITPGRVEVSLHDDLTDFEAWRVALGIDPEAVDHRDLGADLSQLRAAGRFGGAEISLLGYMPRLVEAVA